MTFEVLREASADLRGSALGIILASPNMPVSSLCQLPLAGEDTSMEGCMTSRAIDHELFARRKGKWQLRGYLTHYVTKQSPDGYRQG
jgi:hypothetical protein